MSTFDLLKVCLIMGLANIILSLTILSSFSYLQVASDKNKSTAKMVMLVFSLVLIATVAVFVWYYSFQLS